MHSLQLLLFFPHHRFGLISYEITGFGADKFRVHNETGELFVNNCGPELLGKYYFNFVKKYFFNTIMTIMFFLQFLVWIMKLVKVILYFVLQQMEVGSIQLQE